VYIFEFLFWLVPGIFGGLSIVTGIYLADRSIGRKPLLKIFIAWALATAFAGLIGTIVRGAITIIIGFLTGGYLVGSFVDIIPTVIGLAITGLLMGGIGGQAMAKVLNSIQIRASDTAA